MGRIEAWQKWLDVLSTLVAIWLVVALWGGFELLPEGDYRDLLLKAINIAGTVVSLVVVSIVIFTWRGEWRGTADRQRVLADKAARLADRYRDIFKAPQLEENKLKRADADLRELDSERSLPLGGYPESCRPHGFRHVGKSHPRQNVRCHECARDWKTLNALPWWRSLFIFGKCKNCGFPK